MLTVITHYPLHITQYTLHNTKKFSELASSRVNEFARWLVIREMIDLRGGVC